MIERSLYPKTERIKLSQKVYITEKIDGSNIGFFRFTENQELAGSLIIATRNNIFVIDNKEEARVELEKVANTYRGIVGFVEEKFDEILNNLHSGSGFFGEWKMKGKLSYGADAPRIRMFAKANIKLDNGMFRCHNLKYDRSLFIYPFIDQTIPEWMPVVPLVAELDSYPKISDLDKLYDSYTEEVGRPVEGFIVAMDNSIKKYVRYKNKKMTPHTEKA